MAWGFGSGVLPVRQAALCFLLVLLLPWSRGWAQEITWASSAPTNVPQGEETMDSGQMDYLIHLLPQFTHHVIRVSPARSIYDLRHGEGVCAVGILVTPERQSFALFSARHMVLPSFRLMVPRDRLASWAPMRSPKGEVDLDKVGESLIGGYTNSRHFDPVIADFIGRRAGKGVEGVVATFQLFNLMQANRLDFAFVMPPDLFFYSGKPEDRRKFTLLPIKGVVPTSEAGVACTSDPAGQAAIKAIDALLADESRWVEFVEPFRAWLPPEDYARLLGR